MPRTDTALESGAPSAFEWAPTASREMLHFRAACLARIRAFFAMREVLEVETPMLCSTAVPDPSIESPAVTAGAGGQAGYLASSPEFHMKRLLASGVGSIFQICRAFRAGEQGRLHNPEFSILEWYRAGFDHRALMQEVEMLVHELDTESRYVRSAQTISYRELFQNYAGIDGLLAPANEFRMCALDHGIDIAGDEESTDVDFWRDVLLTHVIEPAMPRGLIFVVDYPASQAALARVQPGFPSLASRFELYIDGIEIANGYHELTDANEQRRRFDADIATRTVRQQPIPALDERLLSALDSGLPDCAGVAMGLDRLLMVLAGMNDVNEVIAFPASCA